MEPTGGRPEKPTNSSHRASPPECRESCFVAQCVHSEAGRWGAHFHVPTAPKALRCAWATRPFGYPHSLHPWPPIRRTRCEWQRHDLDAVGSTSSHSITCGWPRYARHSLRMHGAGGASAVHTSERFCKASNLTVHSGWVVMRSRSSVRRHQQHPGTSCNDSEIASAVPSE